MKLNFEVVIDASIEQVWEALDNPENMQRWQTNLKSTTHKSGEVGRTGAVFELVYDEGGREVVMTETITERREPDFLALILDSNFGQTLVVNHFRQEDDNTTRWESWYNFSFRGFMKILSLFTAGSVRKRTEADLQRFKLMVETDLASTEQ